MYDVYGSAFSVYCGYSELVALDAYNQCILCRFDIQLNISNVPPSMLLYKDTAEAYMALGDASPLPQSIHLSIHFFSYNFLILTGSEKIFLVNSSVDDNVHRAQNNRQKLIHRAKMKSLRISVAIVAAFIICWTPYYAVMIIFMFMDPDKRVCIHSFIR